MGFSAWGLTDRSYLKGETRLRLAGKKSWMMDRLDMFWIYYTDPKTHLKYTWAVDPEINLQGGFYLSSQGEPRPTGELTDKARSWFIHSPHFSQMQTQIKDLKTEYIPYPGPTEPCEVCGARFIPGSKHKHYVNENDVWPYHGKEEWEEEKKFLGGKDPNWGPGYSHTSDPPLEDLGFTRDQIRENREVLRALKKSKVKTKDLPRVLPNLKEFKGTPEGMVKLLDLGVPPERLRDF